MKFGPVPAAEAEGAILAHLTRVGEHAFKKGRVLSADDVAALGEAGIAEVVAARLEAGDVHEDEAATRIATAAAGDGVEAAAAFTGRVNLFAGARGLALIDRNRVDAINLVDESITVATLGPYALVEPRQMLATIKIIPFAAPEAAVVRAVALAVEGTPLVRVAPFVARNVGLVSTRLPGTRPLLLDRNAQSVAARVEALGGRLAAERRCAHTEEAVAGAVRELLDEGCDAILVFGASAIVDRRDVVPAGIVRAGGRVDHFGMPVDPGNLLLLAHAGAIPVLGLPGCARSPKTNGYDWVLRRILAGLEVTRTDIMRMGGGGLLAEIEARPQPRAGAGAETRPAKVPAVAALVLAAGQSRRMGGPNKLLAPVGGTPMVRRVVETALGSGARPVTVVTGHQAEAVKGALADLPVDFVDNPDYGGGLSTSLRRGIAALPPDIDGAVVCLGDMPALTPGHIDRLIASFNPVEGRAICVPTVRGKRGNPVLIAARFFPEIMALEGDIGARHLIGAHADQVCEVPVDALGAGEGTAPIHIDIDTAEALAAYADRQPVPQ